MEKKLLTLFLTLALSVWLLSSAILMLGGSDGLMLRLMRHYAPAAQTGLPDSEYPAVAEMITDYLWGSTDEFQHRYTRSGGEILAFNQKEQQHMADVQGLFDLCWKVELISMLPNVLLPWLTRKKWFARGLRKGLLCVLGAVGLIALWAAIDFESLFILFHRIAFTNDLWLLDPRTDLLIRLMPTEFFVAYAAIIGTVWAAAMGLIILILTLFIKRKKA